MTAEERVRRVMEQWLLKYEQEDYDTDEFLDLQHDVAEAVLVDYPGLFRPHSKVDGHLRWAVELCVADITDQMRRRQKPTRTAKMAAKAVERATELIGRIKPLPDEGNS